MHTFIQKATDIATLQSVRSLSALSHRCSNIESHIHSFNNLQDAQKMGDDLIRRSPTTAKGYLLSGKIYQHQHQWRAASAIYGAGLRLVYRKTNNDYALLKREKQHVVAIIAEKHKQQPPILLPYGILGIIFSSLPLSDLLQCAVVCESWFYAVAEWPEFWNRLLRNSNNGVTQQYSALSLSTELLIDKKQEQYIQSLLVILLHSECHIVKSIHFKDVTLQKCIVKLLARVIRTTSPPMTQLSLENVELSKDLLGLLLDACINMTLFSYDNSKISTTEESRPIITYEANNLDQDEEGKKEEVLPQKITKTSSNNITMRQRIYQQHQKRSKSSLLRPGKNSSATTFQMLTTLKFSGIRHHCTAMLIGLIIRAPNLQSLYLDSQDKINHGQILGHLASRYDPITTSTAKRGRNNHFRFCCISKAAQTHHRRSTTTTGLIIQGGHIFAQPKDISHYLKKLYPSSLELLSIDYDLRVITPRLFLNQNISHLRQLELCCSSLYRNTMIPVKNEPTFETSFCTMLTRCPGLQILVIQDPLGAVPHHQDDEGLLESFRVNITNTVLAVLATACTQLNQLTIEGTCHGYTPSGFNRYANSNGSNNLEYLKVDINPDDYDILQIINMLPRLATLYCNNLGYQTRFSVEPLLQHRGGSLLEDRCFPW